MNFYDPQFAPADVQKHCLIYPSTLRDWRSRDFSKHIGTISENGRWKYSAVDVVELAIANLATRSGIEGFLAFKAARECAPAALYFWGAPVSPPPERYTYFWRAGSVEYAIPIDQLFRWDRTDDLNNIGNAKAVLAFVFDGHSFVRAYRSLGDWLKEELQGGSD